MLLYTGPQNEFFAIYSVWRWLLLCVSSSTTLFWATLPPSPPEDYNLQDKHHPPANTDRSSKIYHPFPPYGRQSTCDHFHFHMLLPPPILSSVSLNVHLSRASLLLPFFPLRELGGRAQKSFCDVMAPSCRTHNICVKGTVKCKSKLANISTSECREYKYTTLCSSSCWLKHRKCQNRKKHIFVASWILKGKAWKWWSLPNFLWNKLCRWGDMHV